MRIREGNDFIFLWALEREGLPEDFSKAIEKRLTASVFGKKIDVPFTIEGNVLKIEFTPEICSVTGVYNLEFSYTLNDPTFSDEDRKCKVDIDAFQIVARTSQADDPSEFTLTSDMAIGYQGKSAYELWLETHEGTEEDYFTWLRQPAITAGGHATEQGDYAKAQGNYAKAQGLYAKEQGDYVAGLQILNSVEYGETEYNEI
jgi:hypothetical protein